MSKAKKLSHYDEAGRAHMVDVSDKTATRREALGSSASTWSAVRVAVGLAL